MLVWQAGTLRALQPVIRMLRIRRRQSYLAGMYRRRVGGWAREKGKLYVESRLQFNTIDRSSEFVSFREMPPLNVSRDLWELAKCEVECERRTGNAQGRMLSGTGLHMMCS